MLVIGLTGGIASGKSTVSGLLKSYQIPVIDLDLLAREVVKPGSNALRAIQRHFAHDPELIDPATGTLNRTRLGAIIFADPAERKWLEALLHPRIRRLMICQVIKLWLTGAKLCVVDSPLLIETGMYRFCGKIIVVYCAEQLQIQRLKARNSLDTEAAQQKIQAQLPLKSKLKYSDYVVENSGTLNELEAQVERLVWKLEREHSKPVWLLSWLVFPFGFLNGLVTVVWRMWFKGIGKDRRRIRSRHSTHSVNSSGRQ